MFRGSHQSRDDFTTKARRGMNPMLGLTTKDTKLHQEKVLGISLVFPRVLRWFKNLSSWQYYQTRHILAGSFTIG
jgi:hypothetical protein